MKTPRLSKKGAAGLALSCLLGSTLVGLSQAPPPLPPATPTPQVIPAPSSATARGAAPTRKILFNRKPAPTPVQPIRPAIVSRPASVTRPQPVPTVVQPPAAPAVTQPATSLVWDQETKEASPAVGEMSAPFTFWVTNVYTEDVVISAVKASCGCTKPVMPETPWTLSPGESGKLEVAVNLSGKSGTLTKYLTVVSTAGQKVLYVKTHIPAQVAPASQMERLQRMQLAMNNKQAVFSGDCASCHVTPGVGKLGKELYAASCGICHDAEHRAAMVPDLAKLNKPTNAEYWQQWITNGQGTDGKPSALMPAFGAAHKGPLTEAQIGSLVAYLMETRESADGGTTAAGPEETSFLKLPGTP